MSNTEIALHNLVRDTPLPAGRPAEILDKVDGLATEGKDVIQNDLSKAILDPVLQTFVNAVPAIDTFVTAMDNIAEVRTFNLLTAQGSDHSRLLGQLIFEICLVCNFGSIQGATIIL